MVAGIDMVKLQIDVALGEKVDLAPALRGHAIECRINAEDPTRGFIPAPGLVTRFRPPTGPFVRIDAGITEGRAIPGDYDSLFCKLLTWGEDRETARRRIIRALGEFEVAGVPTTIPFYRWVLGTLTFIEASHTTKWVERVLAEGHFPPEDLGEEETAGIPPGTAAHPSSAPSRLVVEVHGRRIPVRVWGEDLPAAPAPPSGDTYGLHARGADTVAAPMQGTILKVMVEEGQEIRAGDVICILEAMKMENHVTAAHDGTVQQVAVKVGDVVETGQVLVTLGE
jgi:acetyl-CoA/propionyl-CoA carboxylase biotin carboxyl carrier protein